MRLNRADRVVERPLPTRVYERAEDFIVPPKSVYISATGGEERSGHAQGLRSRSPGADFLDVIHQSRSSFQLDEPSAEIGLRAPDDMTRFWKDVVGRRRCFLDLTGLTHSVWAPLVAYGLHLGTHLEAVYVEPSRYRENAIADPSRDLFDLTSVFEGLAPLPGLASLVDPAGNRFWFVPLLGFEGRRFSYMREHAAPASGQTLPVVGVPGFQPEFVGFAYHGNEEPLLEDAVWQHVAFATANCPFSLYYLLDDLRREQPDAFFKVAPIGTKPHSLGAVLFALSYPNQVEILYDHPQRKGDRTSGKARLLVYHLQSFLDGISWSPN